MILLIKCCFLVNQACYVKAVFYVRWLMLISCQYRRSDWWITKNVLLLVVMLCLTIFFSPDEVVIMVPWKHLFEFGNFRVAFFFFYVPVHLVLFSGGLGAACALAWEKLHSVLYCWGEHVTGGRSVELLSWAAREVYKAEQNCFSSS